MCVLWSLTTLFSGAFLWFSVIFQPSPSIIVQLIIICFITSVKKLNPSLCIVSFNYKTRDLVLFASDEKKSLHDEQNQPIPHVKQHF